METCTIDSPTPVAIITWNGNAYKATSSRDELIDSDLDYGRLHARLALRGIEAEDCHTLEATRNINWRPRSYRVIYPADLRR